MEPSTLHQLAVDHLTQELAQSASQNEEYAKMIDSLRQENMELCIQVKAIEDLNKAITYSHDSRQERRIFFKE